MQTAIPKIRRRQLLRAFTLIELIVVVLMVSIFMATVAVTVGAGAAPEEKLRFDSRKVAAAMERAYQHSQISNAMTAIRYDLDYQLIQVMVARNLDPDELDEDLEDMEDEEIMEVVRTFKISEAEERNRSKVWMESVELYDGTLITRGVHTVRILPTGIPIGHIVQLSSVYENIEDEEIFSIELNPLTGVARVHERAVAVPETEKD